jgi:hypothetical protein
MELDVVSGKIQRLLIEITHHVGEIQPLCAAKEIE